MNKVYYYHVNSWTRVLKKMTKEEFYKYFYNYEVPGKNLKILFTCDCGAIHTSNPNCHSSWCSTNG